MALATYADLQETIRLRLGGRSDIGTLIPDYITLAEEAINKRLRVKQMETTASLTTDSSGEVDLPSDFRELRTLSSTGTSAAPMSELSPAQAEGYWGTITGGTPENYSLVGTTLKVWPVGAATVSLTYYASVPALSNSNTTNWLLTRYPSIYLYGSMREAVVHHRIMGDIHDYDALFERALKEAEAEDTRARWARISMRAPGVCP